VVSSLKELLEKIAYVEDEFGTAALLEEYIEGREIYAAVLGNGVQAFDVPRQDGFRLPDIPGISLRIRYDSPQGWFTYSDEIALDFVNQPRLNWQR
jgi:hypothetical protein